MKKNFILSLFLGTASLFPASDLSENFVHEDTPRPGFTAVNPTSMHPISSPQLPTTTEEIAAAVAVAVDVEDDTAKQEAIADIVSPDVKELKISITDQLSEHTRAEDFAKREAKYAAPPKYTAIAVAEEDAAELEAVSPAVTEEPAAVVADDNAAQVVLTATSEEAVQEEDENTNATQRLAQMMQLPGFAETLVENSMERLSNTTPAWYHDTFRQTIGDIEKLADTNAEAALKLGILYRAISKDYMLGTGKLEKSLQFLLKAENLGNQQAVKELFFHYVNTQVSDGLSIDQKKEAVGGYYRKCKQLFPNSKEVDILFAKTAFFPDYLAEAKKQVFSKLMQTLQADVLKAIINEYNIERYGLVASLQRRSANESASILSTVQSIIF